MARKIIGTATTTGGWARRLGVLLSLVLIVIVGLVFMKTVLAVHDTGVFELDGNATTTTSDDWDEVFNGTDSANVASFTNDGATNATIFTGGGSKDDLDVSAWAHKTATGGLPDKDNLLDAFAARYILPGTPPDGTCPNGTGDLDGNGLIEAPEVPFDPTLDCVVLYFGSDRFDGSGDAAQGFWFFQNQISLGTNKIGGGFGFNGVHENGDLLVLSDFSQGGAVSTIRVFVWDDTQPNNLRLLQESTAANCATIGSSDAFCGIVNAGVTDAPWPYEDKDGNTDFQANAFFEGGINLSLLGLAGECFSSFLSNTRSSTSTNSELKDFVLGEFAACGATLSTTPSVGAGGVVLPGESVTDVATVQGAGVVPPPTPTGDVTFFICGPIASPAVCSTGGTQVGTPITLADSSPPAGEAQATSAAVNTADSPLAPGRYCFRAEWPGDVNYLPTPPETKFVHFGEGDSECFVVRDTTSATTAQNWLPNDSAMITSAGDSALNGTVVFTLHNSDNCTGAAVYTEPTITLTNADSPATVNTTNSAFKVSAVGTTTVSWLMVFSSTDPNVLSTMKCETTTLTITNDIP
jgi:hypothetical protein